MVRIQSKYKLDKETVLENVYRKPGANIYLSQFVKALDESPDKDFVLNLWIFDKILLIFTIELDYTTLGI